MGLRIIVCLFLIILSSCTNTVSKNEKSISQNQIKYAKTLSIFEEENGVKVHIYHPEHKTYKYYFLCKSKETKLPKNHIRIVTPIKSMIALSGTHIGMLAKINGLDALSGVMDEKYIYNPIVLKKLKEGKIQDFGGEESLGFESIVSSKADLLIYSGFGQEFPHAKQLQKAGIVCIANYDWKENHPLGRAEWIKLFAYLIHKEKEAKSYFTLLEKEYNELKAKALKIKDKPTVFSGNVIGDFWYAPAGESYFAELFRDVNANYLYANTKGTGSVELSLEKVLSENRNSEFWFNPGQSNLNLVLKSNNKANFFKAFKKEKIYCYSPNMNLFWEMSAVEPQHVLSDLICILHPENAKNQKLYFYKKLD